MDIVVPPPPPLVQAAGGQILLYTVVNIGAWNMPALGAITLAAIPVTATKIISMTGVIFADDLQNVYPIGMTITAVAGGDPDSGLRLGSVGAGRITINRRGGGFFDNTNFDDAVMNRGYVFVVSLV